MELSVDPVVLDESLPCGRYGVSPETLVELMSEVSRKSLELHGGSSTLLSQLDTSVHDGINTTDGVADRMSVFGTNSLPPPAVESFFSLLFGALNDLQLIILVIAATVSLFIGLIRTDSSHGWIDSIAIYSAVVVVSLVTATNDYSKDKQFQKLNAVKNDFRVSVRRNGVSESITVGELLVGDIVTLGRGDQIPADGIIVDGFCQVNDACMTGESDIVAKGSEPTDDPFLQSGSFVQTGNCKLLVLAVGVRTEWGRTLSELQEPPPKTPLQRKLDRLAVDIGKVGGVAALLIMLVLVSWYFITLKSDASLEFDAGDFVSELVDSAILAICILVVAIPEGLPLAVTISLAYSVNKMAHDNNLVKTLASCETAGGVHVICSDKTGTLTLGKMRCTAICAVNGTGEMVSGDASLFGDHYDVSTEFCNAVCINSDAFLRKEDNGLWTACGSPTEGALLLLSQSLGIDYETVRSQLGPSVVAVYEFTGARKRMSTVVRTSTGFRVYTKGAAELLLQLCDSVQQLDGRVVSFDDELRDQAMSSIERHASNALRMLAVCYRDLDTFDVEGFRSGVVDAIPDVESGLTLQVLCGLSDPLRPGVSKAVETVNRAGVAVRMVTGDNPATARAIAKQCGILTDGLELTGAEFENYSDSELTLHVIPRLQVLSRSKPSSKARLCRLYKSLGYTVAVTGDGNNDAAALREADVGLAMNLSGTEVAKKASDIIILDDQFSSIVRTVLWGRSVFDNVRKFLQFQLTVNVGALIVAFLAALLNFGTPLTVIQLLWVNLIMDTLAALALATEPPEDALLERRPHAKDGYPITNVMIRNILVQGVYQVTVLLLFLFFGQRLLGLPDSDYRGVEHYTLIFNSFVFCQLFNQINARRVNDEGNVFSHLFANPLYVTILLIEVALQVLMVLFGGSFFHTTNLSARGWVMSVVVGAFSLPLYWISRLVFSVRDPLLSVFDRAKPNLSIHPKSRPLSGHYIVQSHEIEPL